MQRLIFLITFKYVHSLHNVIGNQLIISSWASNESTNWSSFLPRESETRLECSRKLQKLIISNSHPRPVPVLPPVAVKRLFLKLLLFGLLGGANIINLRRSKDKQKESFSLAFTYSSILWGHQVLIVVINCLHCFIQFYLIVSFLIGHTSEGLRDLFSHEDSVVYQCI